MDGQRFDRLTKSLATGASRRSVLKGLLGLGGAAAVATVLPDDTDARRSSITITPPPPTTTPAPCRPGFEPCTTNVTGCCAVCGGSTPVTCGLECCASADQCCDGECCAAGSACLTKAFPKGNQAEETCCPIFQTCDNQCCDGTCFDPTGGPQQTGFDRACCPAASTYCPGSGAFADQGLCCSGATPDCCNRDGEPICINGDAQCCTNGDCDDSPSTCQVGICPRENLACSLETICSPDQLCCDGICGACCEDTDCPDDGPGYWRCLDTNVCFYCPSLDEFCADRCGLNNTVTYCGNYDCPDDCGECRTCDFSFCVAVSAGTACGGSGCKTCDGAGRCAQIVDDGDTCTGGEGICCNRTCGECCSDGDCRNAAAGITEAICVNGTCACAPKPVTCRPNSSCGMHSDGCGGLTDCGECTQFPGSACAGGQNGFNGSCTCFSDCTDKECGSDGCAGTCGSCAPGLSCVNFQCVDDACGGACDRNRCEVCIDGTCQVFCNADAGAICCAGDCVFPGPDVCGCGPACDADACLVCSAGTCMNRCGTGQTCEAGDCVGLSCGSAEDCTGGQICADGECCLPETSGQTKPVEGCPPGTFEFAGICFTPVPCTQNADCCSKNCTAQVPNSPGLICTGNIG